MHYVGTVPKKEGAHFDPYELVSTHLYSKVKLQEYKR